MAALTTTLAVAAIATTAASTAANYSAQRKQAKALEREGEFTGRMLERNAAFADQQAADALTRGDEMEGRVKSDTRRLGGAQRAALAAQGVAVSDGSALAVQEEAAELGELDLLTVRNNARREAWGYSTQAEDLRMRAEMARRGAANQADAVRMQSYGTLLTGASNIAGAAYDAGFFDRPKYPKLDSGTAYKLRNPRGRK